MKKSLPTIAPRTLVLIAFVLLAACSKKAAVGDQTSTTEDGVPQTPKVVLESGTPPPATAASPAGNPATAPTQPAGSPPPAAVPPPDPVLLDAQHKAADIEASLTTLNAREGQWQIGDTVAHYTAYLSSSTLVFLMEAITGTDTSQSVRKYYFDNGALTYYHDDGPWREINPPNPIVAHKINRQMVFDRNGKLLTAAKTVDGAAAATIEYEPLAVLTEASGLKSAVVQSLAQVAAARPQAPAATANTPAPVAKAVAGTDPPKSGAVPGPAPRDETGPASHALRDKPAATEHHDGAGGHIDLGSTGRTELSGTLSGKQKHEYTLTAKAGQLLSLQLESRPASARFAVFSSRGEIVADLNGWSAKLPRDGDYRIRVGVSGDQGEAVHYKLKADLR